MKIKSELGVMALENEEYFPFGKQVFFFEDMMDSFKGRKFDVFFFSPLEWQKGRSKLGGYKLIGKEWVKVKEQIPDIIYDRAFSKDNFQKSHIGNCRDFLAKSKRTILNPFGLVSILNNKVKFHQFLMDKNIPTLECYDFSVLENPSFFDSTPINRFYVKPTFGSKGEGIFVIEKQREQYILYDNIGKGKTYKSYTWLLKKLKSLIDTPDRYFVQLEAQINRYKDSPFDIRVLVQNYGDDYKVTGLGARIGIKKSMTSNLNAGGLALPLSDLESFFNKKYGTSVKVEENKIKKICIDCCKALKKEYGEFLEIGFDILCTRDKGPIIIEGNSKPSRWIFNVIADHLISLNESADYYKSLRKETVKVPLVFTDFLLKSRKEK